MTNLRKVTEVVLNRKVWGWIGLGLYISLILIIIHQGFSGTVGDNALDSWWGAILQCLLVGWMLFFMLVYEVMAGGLVFRSSAEVQIHLLGLGCSLVFWVMIYFSPRSTRDFIAWLEWLKYLDILALNIIVMADWAYVLKPMLKILYVRIKNHVPPV